MSAEHSAPLAGSGANDTASRAQDIETQRKQLFKAMSIIEACRMGSDSMLAPLRGADEADFGDALAAAYDILTDVVTALETIGEDNGATPQDAS